MKKILFAILFAVMMTLGASAQSTDAFVTDWDMGRTGTNQPDIPWGAVGYLITEQNSPLGSGLLIMTALGAGYAMTKRRKK
ncbi:MAG: hypothetical protein IKU05_00655 [Bacteroidales bacterium]|nr:hypothetical protein [Bacteroidales bacterium]